MKKFCIIITILVLAFNVACSNKLLNRNGISLTNEVEDNLSTTQTTEKSTLNQLTIDEEIFSSPQNDTSLGLKNIKIDNKNNNLTDSQLQVVQYFDNDYLNINNYEFLMRYPQIYEGAQITVRGIVKKVLSSDNDDYAVLLWLVQDADSFFYRSLYSDEDYENYLNEHKNDYVVIKGKQKNARLIEGDIVDVYGSVNINCKIPYIST